MSEKPKKYRKSTPLIRLRRNVEKIEREVKLVVKKLGWWEGDEALKGVKDFTFEVARRVSEIISEIKKIESSNWVPPEKNVIKSKYEVGDLVGITSRVKDRYEKAFIDEIVVNPELLNHLVINNVLDTGEIVVKTTSNNLFLVVKSHLKRTP